MEGDRVIAVEVVVALLLVVSLAWVAAVAFLAWSLARVVMSRRYLTPPTAPIWDEDIPEHPRLRWIPLGRLPSGALCAFFESDTRACLVLVDGSLYQVDRAPDGTVTIERIG